MTSANFSCCVRRVHMYLALFLTPWILIYALSSLVFNHVGTINQWYGGNLNRFEKMEEIQYQGAAAAAMPREEAAQRILLDLNMDGAHFVPANSPTNRLVIMRQYPYSLKRITYLRQEGKLIIEKQIANLPSILIRMHTRHGFEQHYASTKVWGIGVELTAIAILFWIASGLWLWWEIKPARKSGAAFAAVGLALFAVLLFAI